jgi:hypothetical protein
MCAICVCRVCMSHMYGSYEALHTGGTETELSLCAFHRYILVHSEGIYIHIYIHARTHTHTHTHVNIYLYIHTYIHTYIYIYMCVCACVCVCVCVCVHTYVHTYIRTYVHTYIRTYVHTYIRTYVHIHVYSKMHEMERAQDREARAPGAGSALYAAASPQARTECVLSAYTRMCSLSLY